MPRRREEFAAIIEDEIDHLVMNRRRCRGDQEDRGSAAVAGRIGRPHRHPGPQVPHQGGAAGGVDAGGSGETNGTLELVRFPGGDGDGASIIDDALDQGGEFASVGGGIRPGHHEAEPVLSVKRGKVDRSELLVFAVDEQLLCIREIGAAVEAQVPHDGLVEGGSRSDLGKCLDRARLFGPPDRHRVRIAIAKPDRSECVEELVAQRWDGETWIDQGVILGPGSNEPPRVGGEQTNEQSDGDRNVRGGASASHALLYVAVSR
jgi:hypothetical protein